MSDDSISEKPYSPFYGHDTAAVMREIDRREPRRPWWRRLWQRLTPWWVIALSPLIIIPIALWAGAGVARATPESDFFDTLMDGGITIYDAGTAVARGYQVCEALNHANGEAVAWAIYRAANYTEVPTIGVARLWVIAAATSLCPWHFHPERLMQAAQTVPL